MTRDVFVLGRTNRAGRVGTAERKKLFFFFLANNLLRPVTAAAANRTSVRFDLNTSATRPRTAIITCRAPPNLPPPNAFMGTPAPARIRPAGVLLRRNAGCRRVGRSRKRSPPPRRSESSIIPRHRAGGVPLSRRGGEARVPWPIEDADSRASPRGIGRRAGARFLAFVDGTTSPICYARAAALYTITLERTSRIVHGGGALLTFFEFRAKVHPFPARNGMQILIPTASR